MVKGVDAEYRYFSRQYMKIWCKIQVKINPLYQVAGERNERAGAGNKWI